jgi:hypothetical protein
VILLNSFVLAMEDPTAAEPAGWITALEYLFLVLYTIEMTLKILGMGFVVSDESYLRDPWNIMDFVIVISAYVPHLLNSGSLQLTGLRALRVLRP